VITVEDLLDVRPVPEGHNCHASGLPSMSSTSFCTVGYSFHVASDACCVLYHFQAAAVTLQVNAQMETCSV
jgi:hypothetical protein